MRLLDKTSKHFILLILILFFAAFLRLFNLDKIPVSLFGDEVDIGYHAYSLLKTGRDYTGNFLPLHFESLADYKSSLYAYSIIPAVAIFGISPLGVRLPSAVFGVLSVYLFYLIINLVFKNKCLGLLSAFLLATLPWHLQFSRGGFEVILMLTLLLAGLYFFLKSLNDGKYLIFSAVFFALAPIAYHSGKVLMPLTVFVIILIYFKQFIKISKNKLMISFIIFSLVTVPFAWSTIFGRGLDRFQSTSIFDDPNLSSEIGLQRYKDVGMRGFSSEGLEQVTFKDRFFHNKVVYFGSKILNNYLESFSFEFLFIKGDPNLRHTPPGYGEFLKVEAIFMVLGLIFLFTKISDRKTKLLFSLLTLIAPLPSIITSGGGNHAIRLFSLIPTLVLFVALGVYYSVLTINRKFRGIFIFALSAVFFLSFVFYEHSYWVHYPWDSQKWWHAGYEEAIKSVVTKGGNYEKVIISGANEPPLIYFLGWAEYPPERFQQQYPLAKERLEGFGEVSRLDKYLFPQIGEGKSLYELGSILQNNVLYLATASEIKLDLIKEPYRMPADLILIETILYPSGDPAFYLFTKK